MKYLGIDYGSKHTGLALSDSGGNVAMPHAVVPTGADLVETIARLVENEGVEQIVVGESRNLTGGHNTVQQEIDAFTTALAEHTKVPVVSMNELFSSRQAKWGIEHGMRINPRNADRRALHKKQSRIDDKAAAIILQSYLDAQSKNDES